MKGEYLLASVELNQPYIILLELPQARAAGVLAGHPLDTVKIRLQTQTLGQYRGIIHCIQTIIKKEGIGGLFKGMSSPLASLTVLNAITFGVYGNTIKKFKDKQSYWTYFVAGCASGLSQTVIATPTEMLKLRTQMQGNLTHKLYRSPYHCLQVILREKGARYLYRGSLATQLRDCPAFGVYFVSYEYMARNLSKDGTMDSLTTTQLLFAGGGAGMMSWLLNYPTDVIKTKFQADDKYARYIDVINDTYRVQGYRGFFIGMGSTLLRAFPCNAATFFAVEWTYRIIIDLQKIWLSQKTSKPDNIRFVENWNENEKKKNSIIQKNHSKDIQQSENAMYVTKKESKAIERYITSGKTMNSP